MAVDMTAMPTNHVYVWARASLGAHSLRPVSRGTSQYAQPTNVSATGPPTVMWKWPTIHMVLWTSASMLYDALTMPPKPPKMNNIIPSAGPENAGSLHGRPRMVAMKPLVPLRCAASSNAANIENAVMIDGMTTPYVVIVWSHFQPAEIPGSMNS